VERGGELRLHGVVGVAAVDDELAEGGRVVGGGPDVGAPRVYKVAHLVEGKAHGHFPLGLRPRFDRPTAMASSICSAEAPTACASVSTTSARGERWPCSQFWMERSGRFVFWASWNWLTTALSLASFSMAPNP